MAEGTSIRYPFPQSYVLNYAAKLLGGIARGECVTPVWVAMAGRRVASSFVVNNIVLFEKQLPGYKNYLLVYIEPLDLTEESQVGYLRLIGQSIVEACQKNGKLTCQFTEAGLAMINKEQTTYSQLLDILRTWITTITSQGFEVVLFLGEFDELGFVNSTFCNNLRSLWNRFDAHLHYVFLIKDVRLIFDKNRFGEELGYLFFQNVFYVPIVRENEDYLLDYFETKTKQKLTVLEKKTLAEFCDGHPYFLKLAIESLVKDGHKEADLTRDRMKEILRANYEIRAACGMILGVLTTPMQKLLEDVAVKQLTSLPTADSAQTLLDLGLIKKGPEGYYQTFCLLFRAAVLQKAMPEVSPDSAQRKIFWDDKTNAIVVDGKPADEGFTRQEYEILAYFLKRPNVIHSRDTIAETLWGKDSFDKYSDWAIDQLMSKLRKKLSHLGVEENNLVTIRGRGYKFLC